MKSALNKWISIKNWLAILVILSSLSALLLPSGAAQAQSGAKWTVNTVWFHASDEALSGASNDTCNIAQSAYDFFNREVGKTMDGGCGGVVRGDRPFADYKQCPSDFDCNSNQSDWATTMAVYENLRRIYQKPNMNTVLLVQSATRNVGDGCWGLGSFASDGGFAIRSGMANCGNPKKYSGAAHEMGHGLGLAHVTDGTLMEKGGCFTDWSGCKLNRGQAEELAQGPFFNGQSGGGGGGGSGGGGQAGVRFVFFCNPEGCNGSLGQVDAYAKQVQNWYQGQVGSTFTLLPTTQVQGRSTAAQYRGGDGYDAAQSDVNTTENIKKEPGIVQAGAKTVVVLGFDGLAGCGNSDEFGGQVAIVDIVSNSSIGNPCPRVGNAIMAHELGHLFGLVNSKSGHTEPPDGTLMSPGDSNPPSTRVCGLQDLTNCKLNSNDANVLKSHPYFNSGSGGGGGNNRCEPGSYIAGRDSSGQERCCPNGTTLYTDGKCYSQGGGGGGGGSNTKPSYKAGNGGACWGNDVATDGQNCCPPGYTYSGGDTCSPGGNGGGGGGGAQQPCPSGGVRSNVDGQCHACPGGAPYNANANPPETGCSGGSGGGGQQGNGCNDPNFPSRQGDTCCPPNATRVASGKCCPTGTTFDGTNCRGQDGGGGSGGNGCTDPRYPSRQGDTCCPPNATRVASGKCCPTGTTFDGGNNCIQQGGSGGQGGGSAERTQPLGPTATSTCDNGKINVTFRWTEDQKTGNATYIDFDNDNNWDNGHGNVPVDGALTGKSFTNGVDINLTPGTGYRLRAYYPNSTNSFSHSGNGAFTVATCDTNSQNSSGSAPTAEVACEGGKSVATLKWQSAGPRFGGATYIDIDNDNNWDNGFWNKPVDPNNYATTKAPEGFQPHGAQTPLTFVSGWGYQVRVYNGSSHSSTGFFDAAANCENDSGVKPGEPVQIVGRMFWKGKPAKGVTVEDCNGHQITSDNDGYYKIDLVGGKGFCVRTINRPLGSLGPPTASQSNPEHAGQRTYEYQIAGVNCYHSKTDPPCGPDHQTWDKNHTGNFEYGYDFTWETDNTANPDNGGPPPFATPSCKNGKSIVTLKWTNSGVTYVDVDNDSNWDKGQWSTEVSNTTSVEGPSGFKPYGENSQLELVGGWEYHVRTYSGPAGSTGQHSSEITFTAAKC